MNGVTRLRIHACDLPLHPIEDPEASIRERKHICALPQRERADLLRRRIDPIHLVDGRIRVPEVPVARDQSAHRSGGERRIDHDVLLRLPLEMTSQGGAERPVR